MKGLILSITLLSSGIAATFDGIQDKAVDYYHMASQRLGFGTEEANYGYGMHGYMYENNNYSYANTYGYTEEMQQFMDYQVELVSQYDFSNMSSEELSNVEKEINALLDQKAEELGLDLPDFSSGFGPGMMYGYQSSEQTELMYYMHELMFSYDWSNMTESEAISAREEIDVLIQEKADELGLEFYGFAPHMGGYGYNGSFGSCHRGGTYRRTNTRTRYYRGM